MSTEDRKPAGRAFMPVLMLGAVLVVAGYGLNVMASKESVMTATVKAPAAEAATTTPPPSVTDGTPFEATDTAEPAAQTPGARHRADLAAMTDPHFETHESALPASQIGRPMTLREAYPDYNPEEHDPEHAAVLRGRRDVAVNDAFELDEGGSASIRTLIEQAVYAVDLGDYDAFKRIAVTKLDFEKLLWPEFPQSRPAANIPADEAWEFVNMRNAGGFSKARDQFEKKGVQVGKITMGTTEKFTNFTVHRGITVDITDATGAEFDFPLIRSVVERHGRFKIYSTGD